MAKGSGMIHARHGNDAGVLQCDAGLPADVWQAMVQACGAALFNVICITVDGDTSTNDTVLAYAVRATAAI